MNNNNNIDNEEDSIISFDSNINIDNLLSSKKNVIKNNYWNDDHERILYSLQQSTVKLSNEYQKAYFRYRNKLQNYRIPIIVMSSIAGFLSISNSGYIPQEYGKWVSLLVGFSNLMVTVISLIENFKKIDVNLNKSYNAHINFKKLHDEITITLRLPINERDDNGYNTINEYFTRYQTYVSDAPVLQKILKNYLEGTNTSSTTKNLDDNGSTIVDDSEDSDPLNLELMKNNMQILNFLNIEKNNNNKYNLLIKKNKELKKQLNNDNNINKIKKENINKENYEMFNNDLLINQSNSESFDIESQKFVKKKNDIINDDDSGNKD
jgi:hypothetical protein